MNQVQASRLLTLAHFLRTEVPENQFDQETWGQKDLVFNDLEEEGDEISPICVDLGLDEGPQKAKTTVHRTCEVSCNTSACALGWATVVFPEVLRLHFSKSDLQRMANRAKVQEDITIIGDVQIKNAKGWRNWSYRGLRKLFGLTDDEIDDLFGWEQMTTKQKAQQIEELVDSHGFTYAAE